MSTPWEKTRPNPKWTIYFIASSKSIKTTFFFFGLTTYFKIFRRPEKERGTAKCFVKGNFIYLFILKSNYYPYLDDGHFGTKAMDSPSRTKGI